jgi:hypothetical protein
MDWFRGHDELGELPTPRSIPFNARMLYVLVRECVWARLKHMEDMEEQHEAQRLARPDERRTSTRQSTG